MPDPDPASPALSTTGDFASRSENERIKRGMTHFLDSLKVVMRPGWDDLCRFCVFTALPAYQNEFSVFCLQELPAR